MAYAAYDSKVFLEIVLRTSYGDLYNAPTKEKRSKWKGLEERV